jgi:transketolase
MESVVNPSLKKTAQLTRERVLKMSTSAKSAHAGSGLSCVEILVCLFFQKYLLKRSVEKIILSKGHAAMALYAAAEQFGLIEASLLDNYLQDGSRLWGHPSKTSGFEWIEWSTGSLGHGLPAATGIAYAKKIQNPCLTNVDAVSVVISDGECDEGSNWEAALFAGHHKLSNLVVFLDYNKIQSLDFVANVMSLEPLTSKWLAFGWDCVEVDGHATEELVDIWVRFANRQKPLCVICHTTKGKGVPDIENTVLSHYRPISAEQLERFSNAK